MVKSVINKLIIYRDNSFIFRGSHLKGLKKIVPQNAKDTQIDNIFNNDKAVFASFQPEAAIPFACIYFESIPLKYRRGSWSVGSNENEAIELNIPLKWKKYLCK